MEKHIQAVTRQKIIVQNLNHILVIHTIIVEEQVNIIEILPLLIQLVHILPELLAKNIIAAMILNIKVAVLVQKQ